MNAIIYDTLKKVYGHHTFRPGQQELVEGLLAGRDVLGVMPTGSGKSLCYQIPALLFSGTTLVISPLISLMKDQVTALKLRGITAAFLNSSMDEKEYRETAYQAATGAYKILYVAPERLRHPVFRICAVIWIFRWLQWMKLIAFLNGDRISVPTIGTQ